MKKTFVTLIAALFAASGANAAMLTPDQALARVGSGGPMRKAPIASMELAMTRTFAGSDTPAVYVFNSSNEGYMIVSADDTATPLLGYSNYGHIDANALPPALEYWLGEYARQIEALAPTAGKTARNTPARASRTAIEPLVSTRWDQTKPYNNKCPMVNFRRSVTGCVATAMAQVMKYHNYPETGQGSKEYNYSSNKSLSMDFSTVTFDWANMKDSYTGSYTDAEADAVATLMLACGISTEMQYSPQASGTMSVYVPYALYDYFKYAQTISYCDRDYYTLADWEDMIYAELSNGPVYYSGQSNEGGHAFVCDGYSSDGYFHFNWGWGGMSDGYFRLMALDPDEQGTGGSASGFNFMQAVSTGIHAPAEGDSPVYNLTCSAITPDLKRKTALGGSLKLKGTISNMCVAPVSFTSGVKLLDADGKSRYIEVNTVEDLPAQYGTSIGSVTFPEDLAEGVYRISPAFKREGGEWEDVRMDLSSTRYVNGTVANGEISLKTGDVTTITAEDFSLNSPLYLGSDFDITATLVNESDGEFVGVVAPVLLNGNSAVAYGDYMGIDILPGESQPFHYFNPFSRFPGGTPAPGEYTLALYDIFSGKALSQTIAVTLNAASNPTISASGFTFDGDATCADRDALKFKATLSCSKGYFSGRLNVSVFTMSSSYVTQFTSDPVFAEAGQTADVTVTGTMPDAEIGSKYMAALYNGNVQITDIVTFTIGQSSGIEDVTVGDKTSVYPNPTDGIVHISNRTDADVYSLAGSLVLSEKDTDILDLSSLPAGVYIVRTGSETHRVIKR